MLAAAFRSIGLDARVTARRGRPHARAGRQVHLGRRVLSAAHRARGLPAPHRGPRSSIPRRPPSSCPPPTAPAASGSTSGCCARCWTTTVCRTWSILPITSADGYAGIGEQAGELIRTAWRSVVIQDILLKLLLMTRPYEVEPGQTDKVYLESLRHHGRAYRPPGHHQQGAPGRRQGRAGAGEESIPRHPGQARRPAAHRRGGRDLLPPQHLRQQRGDPAHRGPGRRVLAGRRGRVGVVHQRRGLPAPAGREAPGEQGLAQELSHGSGHAERRERPHGGLRGRVQATPRPPRAGDLRARAPLSSPRGLAGRDGAVHRRGRSTCTTRAPTASSTSAPSPV